MTTKNPNKIISMQQDDKNNNIRKSQNKLNNNVQQVDINQYLHDTIFDVVQPSRNLQVKLCSISNLNTIQDDVYSELISKQNNAKKQQSQQGRSNKLYNNNSNTAIFQPFNSSQNIINLDNQKYNNNPQSLNIINSMNTFNSIASQKQIDEQVVSIKDGGQLGNAVKRQSIYDQSDIGNIRNDNASNTCNNNNNNAYNAGCDDEIYIQLNLFSKKNQSSITPRNAQFLSVKKNKFQNTLQYLQSLNEIGNIYEEKESFQTQLHQLKSQSQQLIDISNSTANAKNLNQQQDNQNINIYKKQQIDSQNQQDISLIQLNSSQIHLHSSKKNSFEIIKSPILTNANNNNKINHQSPLIIQNNQGTLFQENKLNQTEKILHDQQNQFHQTPQKQSNITPSLLDLPQLIDQDNINIKLKGIKQQSSSKSLKNSNSKQQLNLTSHNMQCRKNINIAQTSKQEDIKEDENDQNNKIEQNEQILKNSLSQSSQKQQQYRILRNENIRVKHLSLINLQQDNTNHFMNQKQQQQQQQPSTDKTADTTPFQNINKINRNKSQLQYKIKQDFSSPVSTNAHSKQAIESQDKNDDILLLDSPQFNQHQQFKDNMQFFSNRNSNRKEIAQKNISPFSQTISSENNDIFKQYQKNINQNHKISNELKKFPSNRYDSPAFNKISSQQLYFDSNHNISQQLSSAQKRCTLNNPSTSSNNNANNNNSNIANPNNNTNNNIQNTDQNNSKMQNNKLQSQNTLQNFQNNQKNNYHSSQFSHYGIDELSTANVLQQNQNIDSFSNCSPQKQQILQKNSTPQIITESSSSERRDEDKRKKQLKKRQKNQENDEKKQEPMSQFINNINQFYHDQLQMPQSIQLLNNQDIYRNPKFSELENNQNEIFRKFISLPPFRQGKVKCGIKDYIKNQKSTEMNRFKTYYLFGFSASNKDEKSAQLQNILEGVIPSSERGNIQCSDLWSDKHVKIIHDRVNFAQEKQCIQSFITYKTRNPVHKLAFQNKKPSSLDFLAQYENYEKKHHKSNLKYPFNKNNNMMQSKNNFTERNREAITQQEIQENISVDDKNCSSPLPSNKNQNQNILAQSCSEKLNTKSSHHTASNFKQLAMNKLKLKTRDDGELLLLSKEKHLFQDLISYTDRVLKNNANDIQKYKKLKLYEDEESK